MTTVKSGENTDNDNFLKVYSKSTGLLLFEAKFTPYTELLAISSKGKYGILLDETVFYDPMESFFHLYDIKR